MYPFIQNVITLSIIYFNGLGMVEFVNASATTQKKTGMSFFRAAFLSDFINNIS